MWDRRRDVIASAGKKNRHLTFEGVNLLAGRNSSRTQIRFEVPGYFTLRGLQTSGRREQKMIANK